MNLIKKTFESYDVRTLVLNSEPWFMAKDIAIILGYSETNAMVKRLDTEDIKTILRNDGSFLEQEIFGNQGSLLLINESGLYASILGSKKPEAKQFKKWVTSEVLPSIRKHGAYMTPDTIERALTDPDFLIELATKLKEEKSKREQAEKEKQILEEEKVKALPKIQVFDSIINQDGLFSIRSTAKTIQVPERKFIDFLIEKKVVFRNPQGNLEPFAKTIDKGLMEIKLVETEKGGARSQAKFTSYGMAWITLLVDKYSSYFPPELTSSPCKQN